jgi:large subunit ribosomal protein L15
LNLLDSDVVDLNSLIEANLIPAFSKNAKIIQSGVVSKAVTVKGIKVTVGAKASIEAAGGKIEA